MKASDIIDELKTFYKDGVEYRSLERHLTEADVERWSSECGWSRSQLFDEIAQRLALGYSASELSFDFCDVVVNDLAGPVTNTSGTAPQIFWEVYSAFDEGTLYPLLRRLETQGLLASQWREEEKRKKRFYLLSSEGALVLDQLLAEWRSIDASIHQVLKEQAHGND